ncbi:MAG: glucokinase [Anaerolineae bacterium]|nr:glucokinase [Thermoflexales bacterium]MDW8395972.1 glucokinase [Anaerolineae bacterium]
MTYILAGDIGGTKTLLAVYSPEDGLHRPVREATYPSANYPDLESIVRAFLADAALPIHSAAFGVAGPVMSGKARITNLPWSLDEQTLRDRLGLPRLRLINDLQAIAAAVPFLRPEDLVLLNDVPPNPHGPIGVVAPGTGLGEAFVLWVEGRYRPFPSEGGHADFAPGNELESDLLRYLQRKFGRASYERVCSGIGIPNVYAFLRDGAYYQESPYVAEQLQSASDPTPVIIANAMADSPDPLCAKVMEIFASVLAAKAGNLALTIIATGGIYLGGGIPPRILPLLQRESFMNTFRYKGRLSALMMQIPVRVILNTRAGLFGAAQVALELM